MNKKEALFYRVCKDSVVQCTLCPHQCRINPEKYGKCGVRKNDGGVLIAGTYGYPVATHIDPIEKKPLYHFLPGTTTYSIATRGCNFSCGFCQNWEISQSSSSYPDNYSNNRTRYIPPEKIVDDAIDSHCKSISFTYTEPTVFYEYMRDIAQIAKGRGVKTVLVSNGYMAKEAAQTLAECIDACNIDIKSFSALFYRKNCGGTLQPVLDTVRILKERGVWVEITTLVIPDENDSAEELGNIASFIGVLGTEIPWHISRFFPRYKFDTISPTPTQSIERAFNVGRKHDLKYIYPGNHRDTVYTYCSKCGIKLVEHKDFSVILLTNESGICPVCGTSVEGIWK